MTRTVLDVPGGYVIAEVEDPEKVPRAYLRVSIEIDSLMVRCALRDGIREIPGLRIVEKKLAGR